MQYLLFAFVLPVIFLARGVLYSWMARTGFFCLFTLIAAEVVGLDLQVANGSLTSVANCMCDIVCGILLIVGVAAPPRCFVAFRIFGAVLFLRLLTGAPRRIRPLHS
jgi:hypothetical protein